MILRKFLSFSVDGQDPIVVIRTSLQLTRMRRGPKLRLQRLDGKWRVQIEYLSWGETFGQIQIQIEGIFGQMMVLGGFGVSRLWCKGTSRRTWIQIARGGFSMPRRWGMSGDELLRSLSDLTDSCRQLEKTSHSEAAF